MRSMLAVAALIPALASLASGQAPERSSFYLLLGNDTLITERVTRTPTELRGEFVDRMRGGRMAYVATLAPDASITKRHTLPGRHRPSAEGDVHIAGDRSSRRG